MQCITLVTVTTICQIGSGNIVFNNICVQGELMTLLGHMLLVACFKDIFERVLLS